MKSATHGPQIDIYCELELDPCVENLTGIGTDNKTELDEENTNTKDENTKDEKTKDESKIPVLKMKFVECRQKRGYEYAMLTP